MDYLAAYYFETGVLIDLRKEEKDLPDEKKRIIFGVGAFVFVIGASGLNRG